MGAILVRSWAFAVISIALVASGMPGCRHHPPDAAHDFEPAVERVGSELARAVARARDDILLAGLMTETPLLRRSAVRKHLRNLDFEAAAISASVTAGVPEGAGLDALNARFFGPEGFAALNDLSGPETVSVAAVLDNRRGTCVGLAIVYLALAQRLGLDAHAVATPVHLFIRVDLGDRLRNVELLEASREIDDDTYRRRYKINEASIAAGVFMRELSNSEVIAHLLSNQAVVMSKQAKLDSVLSRYDAALQLQPELEAAWYNRGIDLMNAGRLQEALENFSRAIGLHPADAQAHNNRGLTKLKLGDAEGARADFLKALEIEPALFEAEQNLKRLDSKRK